MPPCDLEAGRRGQGVAFWTCAPPPPPAPPRISRAAPGVKWRLPGVKWPLPGIKWIDKGRGRLTCGPERARGGRLNQHLHPTTTTTCACTPSPKQRVMNDVTVARTHTPSLLQSKSLEIHAVHSISDGEKDSLCLHRRLHIVQAMASQPPPSLACDHQRLRRGPQA